MTTSSEELVQALRESLKENDRLWQRYQDLVTASREPIAIVGMGCRFPGGVASPEALWELVASAGDGMSPFPADRGWDLQALGDIAEVGGFVHEAPRFDAELFGISPREALAMDPQQRLLLETSWEALERAGINPLSLRGSRTGVFSGASGNGYGGQLHEAATETEGYLLTGSIPSVASGRVAYSLGFEGPAVTVDTACSSALVALHLACQALRAGECTMALAGGATVMSNPGMFLEFARQGGLAGDGRCKSFAEAADGTGWSEGAGVLVLERLSDARRLGHDVLAVVRGSAVNQDGASNGLSAPNGPSQQRVIRQALEAANISAAEVDAVEAHGTGTRLGDPIEAQALMATYGQQRDGDPLWLGSVKSNIGHTQCAAGVAGVIKMVLALREQRLPRTLHADEPSSHVDWTAGAVRLLAGSRTWPRADRTRRAGVSAFGISGTNAHVIVEEAPAAEPAVTEERPSADLPVVPWVLSGRGERAVRAQAERLAAFLGERDHSPVDVGFSLAATRAVLEHRSVVLGPDREALRQGVTSLADGGSAVVSGAVTDGRTGWMFTGQGSQRLGMGRELYGVFPVFAKTLDEVCGLLDAELAGRRGFEVPVREVLFAAEGSAEAALLDRTGYAQTALFAVQVALVELLRSWGMGPDVVVGHSVGEFVAAYVAGVFELGDAARLVAGRARLMQALPAGGAMAAVEGEEAEVSDILRGLPDSQRVAVAAVNGPGAVVVSGDEDAVERVMAVARERGRRVSRLRVSHAFHSPLMEPMLAEFADIAAGVTYRQPVLPAVSTVTGAPVGEEDWATADYWVDQVRRPVRFHDALETATGTQSVSRLLEVGPDPVLTSLAQAATEAAAASALRKGRAEAESVLSAAAEMFVRGAKLDWAAVFAGTGAQRVELPTYAFQHQRFWLQPSRSVTDASGLGLGTVGHPLLGAALRLAGSDTVLLTSRLSAQSHPWLSDHVVAGSVVVPGTVFVELAVQAGDQVGCDQVEDLTLRAPLILPNDGTVQIQISIEPAEGDRRRTVRVYSRPQDAAAEQPWTLHATGTLTTARPAADWDLRAWPPEGAEPVPADGLDGLYDHLSDAGLAYGPGFRGVKEVWRRGEDLFVEAVLPEQIAGDVTGFGLHPALLDTVLHALGLREPSAEGAASLPFLWSGVSLFAVGATAVRARLSPRGGPGSNAIALRVADAAGEPVAEVGSLVLRPVSAADLVAGADGGSPIPDSLFRLDWTAASAPTDRRDTGEPGDWAVLGDPHAWQDAGVPVTGYAGLTALTAALDEGGSVPDTVLLPLPHDPRGTDTEVAAAVTGALELVREWLAERRLTETRLVVVTSGAVGAEAHDLAGAGVWGLLRSAMSEHPGRFVLADVDGEPTSYATLATALADGGESQFAVRRGEVWLPRMARMTGASEDGAPGVWQSQGTVLVTGGTGGLGAVVARHLVSTHGVRNLLLLSRRGPDAPGAHELQRELTGLGAEVTITACDVADRRALAKAMGGIPDDAPLTGVVHTAGVLDDGMITDLTPERVARVLAAKAESALHLHELTADNRDLTSFVLFSSIAGVFGNSGQAAYAAANTVLDTLALSRRSQGLPGVSLAWGMWEHADGMGGRLGEANIARLRGQGFPPLSTQDALALFDLALRTGEPLALPVALRTTMLAARRDSLPTPLHGLLPAAHRRRTADQGTDVKGLARRLSGLSEAERHRVLLHVVQSEVAAVLGHASAGAVDPGRAFKDLGFDSLTAVDLRNRLNNATALTLPATLVFDHPSPTALAAYLRERLLGETPAGQDIEPRPSGVMADDEPIAIVGMGCRYPGGVTSPEGLWELVDSAGDGITGFPTDRGWDVDSLFDPDGDRAGTSYVREGGFLHDAAEFDAELFGISPREALAMDPQQRLLLETSWEALERAGINPLSLRGSSTGVFAGLMYHDYASRLQTVPEDVEGFVANGNAGSVFSGRVAYVFGFEGPAVTVDTACSSSLVSLHWACQALRAGECDTALAGGVTVMATPSTFVEFSRQRGLASDGRCKSFADGADGTGWAEGAGVLVLERLSDARRRGHHVLAVVRGSAVNQDGASNGLTAPNGPSQQRVIRQALSSARLSAAEVDVVEAHGTGTRLGDPIEAQGLLATYGQARTEDEPLWLGSVKSNIGHTQAAAGVAGVIKMVMALRAERLPRTLHVNEPSGQVDWTAGAVQLLREARRWPMGERPRRAGISSFGISGTNAHVIVEEAPAAEPATADERPTAELPVVPWVLSARSAQALRAQAGRLAALADERDHSSADLGLSLVTTRALLDHRAVVLGGDPGALRAGVAALAEGDASVVSGVVREGRTGWMFTGQGSQRLGMGRELYEQFPRFAMALDEVCGHLEAALTGEPGFGTPVRDVLFAAEGSDEAELLDRTGYAQTALFAVQVALVELLRSWGMGPDAVLGHSVGEFAAAYAAGVFDLADATRLVAGRARVMQRLPAGGAMAAIEGSEEEVLGILRGLPGDGRITIAAVNGPSAVVVSGDQEAVERAMTVAREQHRRVSRLSVSHAFHSPLMEPALVEFADIAAGVDYRQPKLPALSTVTGESESAEDWATPEYWVRQIREPVRFHDALVAATGVQGVSRLLEIGPDPVLTALAQSAAEDVTVASVLRKGRPEAESVLGAVAEVFVRGSEVDWTAVFAGSGARPTALPTYAFQRQRYWLGASRPVADARGLGLGAAEHPLLGATVTLAGSDTVLLTSRLSVQSHPWLADHAVAGSVLVPGTVFVELAVQAGDRVDCDRVEELTLQAPLVLPEQHAVHLQLSVETADGAADERRALKVYSRPEGAAAEEPWTLHATGTLTPGTGVAADWDLAAWPPAGAEHVPADGLYERLADEGLVYGPAFRGLREVWRQGDDFYVEAALPEPLSGEAAGFGLHPALLDSVLHALGLRESADEGASLPFMWSGVSLSAIGAAAVRVRISVRGSGEIALRVADGEGAPVAEVESLVLRPVSAGELAAANSPVRDSLFCLDWIQAPTTTTTGPEQTGAWAVLGDTRLGAGVPRATAHADLEALIAALDAGAPVPDTVVLPFDATGAAVGDAVAGVLAVIRTWLAQEHFAGSRLVVLTSGAVDVRPEDSTPGTLDLAGAGVWGLVRSAMSEHPGRFALADVDGTHESYEVLAAALSGPSSGQVAVREGRAWLPRMARMNAGGVLVPPAGAGSAWRMDIVAKGRLDGVALVPENPAPLGPGQVRVAVRASGVNFRDVLNVLDMYPGDAGLLGHEGAGVVLEVGPGVSDWAVGDRVMGLLNGGFGPTAVADGRMLARIPAGWSYPQAASVPIVYLTAYYALVDLAGLEAGESVLIHAAAGGVGMAAVQLAQHLRAEVFATASQAKWQTVRDLDVSAERIASSRTTEFEEVFSRATDGAGLDVVLDCLAGEFVDASLRLTRSGGRFVEMGKTDIRDPDEVAEAHPGVSYRSFDVMDAGPERIGEMLAELLALFESGALRPLPVTTWDIARAPEALRFLGQAKHVGKVVLTVPAPWREDGTVLITGGTGGLGALVARHLVTRHGVRNLALLSRRGPEAPGARALERELVDLGARVTISACDVSDRTALAGVLDAIPDEAPLTGVVHTAGVLDDGIIADLTPERLARVLAAKADSAMHLHELTVDRDLDAFVLFSSIAGVVGNAGQAPYAAANSVLDALAVSRRAQNLPAVSLAWGMWAHTEGMGGTLGESDLLRMARQGFPALETDHGLSLLDIALQINEPLALPIALRTSALTSDRTTLPDVLHGLAPAARQRPDAGQATTTSRGELGNRLLGLPVAEQNRLLLELVQTEVAGVLGHASGAAIDPARAFKDLGFDSLTAVDLRNRMNAATGLRLPATLTFDHPTPYALAGYLREEVLGAAVEPAGTPAVPAPVGTADEQIVIVGMGCRFPGGVTSPESLWDLVASAGDGITPFPADRGWDARALRDIAAVGGFVQDAGDFDAELFGISPREALAMDPQQRLLLETSWEALERAGIDPQSLRGSATGVFAGVSANGYGGHLHEAGAESEGYLLTGATPSVASGRLSYSLGLEGPAVSVDTACSSALVALHLACQALRAGECTMALAGGATIMANPGMFLEFSRQGGLAGDGRCKSFAEAADGTGWAEGAGVLVLERLSDARRLGHPVLAVVRGSAVNQDGASNGLTAPNGPSQQRVIRQALAAARISPSEVDAVEAHGTGTRLGDPIEAQALMATYGQDRDGAEPLWLGSVKSNIGHPQAAAGVAGLIKMVMALRERRLPQTLHADAPSSHVDWTAGAVELLSEAREWPRTEHPRRAGVSSFGISGTNAHVIIEEAPAAEPAMAEERPTAELPVVPWVLSGRNAQAVRAQAGRLAAFLDGRDVAPVDVGLSLTTTRAALEHRAVVLGAEGAILRGSLTDLDGDSVVSGVAAEGRTGWMFTGQGSQRLGMGRELYGQFPVFARVLDEVCGHLDAELSGRPGFEVPVREVLFAAEGSAEAALLDRTGYAQSGLFAVQAALVELLRSWGVVPDVVLGHSIGEVAAAYVAGVFGLGDAARLVAGRARLMQALPAGGAMAAVEGTESEVSEILSGLSEGERATVAAVNGPVSVVVSGEEDAVERVMAVARERGRRVSRLRVSHAFHSPLMEPMLAEFADIAASVTYRQPTLAAVSTVTGEPLADSDWTTPAYWVDQVREPVRFHDALLTATAEQGATRLLEVGPDPVLASLAPAATNAAAAAVLRQGRAEAETLLAAVAEVFVRGADVDWPAVFAGTGARRVDLPTYAFQRQRFWLRPAPSATSLDGVGLGAAGHPLLGASVAVAGSDAVLLTSRLSVRSHPWLADHVVAGSVLVPGTAFVELAVQAGDRVGCDRVAELTLQAPLVLSEDGAVQVQLSIDSAEDGGRALRVYSRPEEADAEQPWTLHATGALAAEVPAGGWDLRVWPPVGAEAVVVDGLYERLSGVGLAYGPAFRGLREVWKQGEDLFVEAALPEEVAEDGAGFGLHPALLDTALHALALQDQAAEGAMLPFLWSGVSLSAVGASAVRVRITPRGKGQIGLRVADAAGEPVAEVESLVLRPVSTADLAAANSPTAESLFRLEWVPAAVARSEECVGSAGWAVLGDVESGGWRGAGVPVTGYADLAALTAALDDGSAVPDTVVLPLRSTDTEVTDTVAGVLAVVREWLAERRFVGSRLVVLTSGAVEVAPAEDGARDVLDLAGAGVWGLVRSAISEHPGRFVLADVDGEAASFRALAGALGEGQFAVRGGEVWLPRLVRMASGGVLVPPPGADSPWRMEVAAQGRLDGVALVPEESRPLEPGQVRVGVRAAGVNFRDVLNVLGMYPGDAGRMGLEGAGVVLEVGPGVADFAVGDRVMGLLDGAFGPAAVADARMLARMPSGWSYEQAASVPVVFLTAYYALVDLAGLGAGESVLVHAAAGGVGMAAVQLARHLGAEVFATASQAKWPVVRELGVAAGRLASSRTTEFEEVFSRATDGAGLNVVLDCLAGEFVDASLRLTQSGGRFVEMGKTDIRDADEVAAAYPGVSYRAFDVMEAGPDRIGEMLAALLELFEDGALQPVPVTSWEIARAPEALRFLGQAKHVGKVVLTVPAPWGERGTVLVTGGTGGLGAVVARHLVTAHGVRDLLLVSRRGVGAPGAEELREELTGLGARVAIAACDVSDRAALSDVLDTVAADTPLTGVVHAAGVLDDGLVADLTPERLAGVLAAKAESAVHLHELTADRDLDAFVLFSSFAGVVGNAGQAAYAASNAVLDALAVSRRAQGLTGVSLAWGMWEQAEGMGGRLGEADIDRLRRQGFPPLSTRDGLALLDTALRVNEPVALPVALRTASLAGVRDSLPGVLQALVPAAPEQRRTAGRSSAGEGGALVGRLRGLPPVEQDRVLLDVVQTSVAGVLGHASAAAVEPTRAFKDLGFDSLTAVDLRNRLSGATGLHLSATMVFDHPTPASLAGYLREQLLGVVEEQAVEDRAVERAGAVDEPIAIVGMGCRYPGGVTSPETLWELVASGGDGMSPLPVDRGWDMRVLDDIAAVGGFVEDATEFDAELFGISPREALAMDPQQRLLLETSWEALERAGIDPLSLRGTTTGVFSGVSGSGYGGTMQDPEGETGGYLLTGSTPSVASGRVAYALGFEGPAVSVDTACSSSLVALHLACQALRAGECEMALAGGATVMATPGIFLEFSRQGGLAGDGRCKSFSDAADGTGWAEGAGVLVLERLSEAERLGHPVLAVVRGSAVNQDGASNGLTAPNGPSQQRVIRQALANARLSASDVDAVEAHGTGTTLGDPIEAQALLATYGQGRDGQDPLRLGSIKSNIGHSQAAAGAAGLIKMVMALREGQLPKTLYVDRPSSHVVWESGAVELLTEARAWPRGGHRPRRAGVSSFGISGTNAHVIIEEAEEALTIEPPVAVERPSAGLPVVPWVLSGRNPQATRAQAARLAAFLAEGPDRSPADVGLSLATTRAALEHRAVVLGTDFATLHSGVAALADGDASAVSGVSAEGRTAWMFTGQGSQRPGMGCELYERFPVFARTLDEVCGHMDADLDGAAEFPVPVRQVLFADDGSEEAGLLDRTGYAQTALFAVQASVVELLRSWGMGPDVVLGHSVGELAAAYAAGVFDLADAARLVAGRARLMQALPSGGAMAAIEGTESEVADILGGFSEGERVAVAAVNGPTSVVVSGDEEAVERVMAVAGERGRRVSRLRVSHAFHSPLMEPMLAEFAEITASVTYRQPILPATSTLTGRPVDEQDWATPDYWVRQVRSPVRFHDALLTATGEQAAARLLEIGPDPVLTALAQSEVDTAVSVLRKGRAEGGTVMAAVAELFVHGDKVDWSAVFAESGAERIDLPTYAFQRQRYWLEASRPGTDASGLGLGAAGHPLLGASVSVAGSDAVLLTSRLSVRSHPWLADHVVAGSVLVPGTAFVELAVQAGDRVGCGRVEELTLRAPLVLPEDGAVQVQLSIDAPESGEERRSLRVYARPEGASADRPWTLHATGTLTAERDAADWDLSVWPPAGAEPVALDGLYERLTGAGLVYGPAFRGLGEVWVSGGDVFVEAALPEEVAGEASAYGVHPALLDTVLHALGLQNPDAEGAMLPFLWSGVSLSAVGVSVVRVRLSRRGSGEFRLRVADAAGDPVVEVASLVLRPVSAADLAAARATADSLFRLEWTPAPTPAEPGERGGLAVLGTDPRNEDGWSAAGVAVTGYADLGALIAALDDDGVAVPRTVVLPVAPHSEDLLSVVAGVLGAMRTWLAEERLAGSRLMVSTTGAVAVSPASDTGELDLAAAGAWGLVRSAMNEHPGRFALADVDGEPDSYRALAAYPVESGEFPESGESQFAVRQGRTWVPRVTRMTPATGEDIPATRWDKGTVLVTGGTGGLGAVIARHLVSAHGVGNLLLISRRGPQAPGAQQLRRELTDLGARVTITACDVSDERALADVLDKVPDDAPLAGVVHAAGVLDDGMITDLTPERLADVLSAKAESALHLHHLTVKSDLQAFVLFSSIAGVVGNAGQSAYAASNTVLDALAVSRRAQGLPGVSLAWGMWEHPDGMGGRLGDANLARLRGQGFAPLTTEHALALFDMAVRSDEPIALPVSVDTTALAARRDSLPGMLQGLVPTAARQRRAGDRSGAGSADALARRLRGRSAAERDRVLLDLVQSQVAMVLGHGSAGVIDPGRAFKDLGFDSLTAVDLRNRLNSATGLTLPASLAFDHPTIEGLAGYLREQLDQGSGEGDVSLSDLEKFEAAVLSMAQDGALRKQVRSRVKAMVARLEEDLGGDGTENDDIDSASLDSMFEIIDRELEG